MYTKPIRSACGAVMLMCFASNSHAGQDDQRFAVGFSYELPISGTLNVDENTLYGLDFKYFLDDYLNNNPYHLFLSAGYRADSDRTGTAWDIFHFSLGGQYDFGPLWGKRSYLEYTLGAAYSTEQLRFDLLDRTVNESFNHFGYKATVGYGMAITERLSSQLRFNVYGGDISSRSLSLELSYSF